MGKSIDIRESGYNVTGLPKVEKIDFGDISQLGSDTATSLKDLVERISSARREEKENELLDAMAWGAKTKMGIPIDKEALRELLKRGLPPETSGANSSKDKIVLCGETKERNTVSKKDFGRDVDHVEIAPDGLFFVNQDGASISAESILNESINELMKTKVEESGDSTQGIKADDGKPRLSLVPTQIIWDIADTRMYGIKKYGESGVNGWKKISPERYRDALFRHMLRYLDDPDGVDDESGLPHLSHVAFNVAALCELKKLNSK